MSACACLLEQTAHTHTHTQNHANQSLSYSGNPLEHGEKGGPSLAWKVFMDPLMALQQGEKQDGRLREVGRGWLEVCLGRLGM